MDDLTEAEMAKLAEILEVFKRNGVELVPVKDDGTPETVQ